MYVTEYEPKVFTISTSSFEDAFVLFDALKKEKKEKINTGGKLPNNIEHLYNDLEKSLTIQGDKYGM